MAALKMKKGNYDIEFVGAIAGILSIVLYLSAAAFSFLPDAIGRLFAFTFPLLWIISFLGLYTFLAKENRGASLQIALLFGIIGGAVACTMLVMQQANYIWYEMSTQAASTGDEKELARTIFLAIDKVQSAMDIAFDIFMTLSWTLFGYRIAQSKKLNRFLGYVGSTLALGLLVLNLYTFPNPPADSGLFDLGPFLGVWAFIFYLYFLFKLQRVRQPKRRNP